MWLKKKYVLQAKNHYNREKSADGSDMRTSIKRYENRNSSIKSGLPSAADASNYFYLPALGYYHSGQLYDVGNVGYYWSSSKVPFISQNAYCLFIEDWSIVVNNNNNGVGCRVGTFE